MVIPEKWDWPQKDDRNWVYAFDDSALSVEGFSKLMVHHWITKGHNKHRARTEKPKVKNAIHSSNQWLPEVSIYRQNKAITLPSYQHFEDDHISDKVFWLHLAKVVKIYFPRASTGSEGKLLLQSHVV